MMNIVPEIEVSVYQSAHTLCESQGSQHSTTMEDDSPQHSTSTQMLNDDELNDFLMSSTVEELLQMRVTGPEDEVVAPAPGAPAPGASARCIARSNSGALNTPFVVLRGDMSYRTDFNALSTLNTLNENYSSFVWSHADSHDTVVKPEAQPAYLHWRESAYNRKPWVRASTAGELGLHQCSSTDEDTAHCGAHTHRHHHEESTLDKRGFTFDPELPSVGSALHSKNLCTPCMYRLEPGGCKVGKHCSLCHFCTEPCAQGEGRENNRESKISAELLEIRAQLEQMYSAVMNDAPPNHGSNLHFTGECQPCVFIHKKKGCRDGNACQFCHLCNEDILRLKKHTLKKTGKYLRSRENRIALNLERLM